MKFMFPIVLAVAVIGCSQKSVYSNLQNNHIRSCERFKSTQYDDCVNQYRDSYEDYTEKRQETLGK